MCISDGNCGKKMQPNLYSSGSLYFLVLLCTFCRVESAEHLSINTFVMILKYIPVKWRLNWHWVGFQVKLVKEKSLDSICWGVGKNIKFKSNSVIACSMAPIYTNSHAKLAIIKAFFRALKSPSEHLLNYF